MNANEPLTHQVSISIPRMSAINFPSECLIYLLFMGIVQAGVAVAGSIIVTLVSSFRRRELILTRIVRFNLFNGLLLVVGASFNGLWSCLIWGRLYESMDYVVDFVPFWPITQSVIDAAWGNEHGRLFGISLWQLQLIWFAFAAGTWWVTILLYRRIIHRISNRQPVVAIPATA